MVRETSKSSASAGAADYSVRPEEPVEVSVAEVSAAEVVPLGRDVVQILQGGCEVFDVRFERLVGAEAGEVAGDSVSFTQPVQEWAQPRTVSQDRGEIDLVGGGEPHLVAALHLHHDFHGRRGAAGGEGERERRVDELVPVFLLEGRGDEGRRGRDLELVERGGRERRRWELACASGVLQLVEGAAAGAGGVVDVASVRAI